MFKSLRRYPHQKIETLQAWDAADELIIEHLETKNTTEKRILIVNDAFGALSVSLGHSKITTYTDSYVSQKAILLNGVESSKIIHTLDQLSGLYDLVLIKLPKNMSFFEDILCRLTPHLNPHSEVIVGSMIKHLPKTSFDLLNRIIGETHTSLAKKKARLIFSNFQKQKIESPYPLKVSIEKFEKPFTHHSNLFSREKLDIGTRFLLEHLPKGDFNRILDLGCANGIVGIAAKKMNPKAQIIFSDDSEMAIESAKENYAKYFEDVAHFVWTNCFEEQIPNFLDLVICNPPFHQGASVSEFVADQMFTDTLRTLKRGGCLRVIGNSHLSYPSKLKRIFGNSEIIATNAKFIITQAIKN